MDVEDGATSGAGALKADVFSPDLLRVYYDRLFPYELITKWLSYGNDPDSDHPAVERDFFLRREWSFTLLAPDESEIYIRYRSYPGAAEMKRDMMKMQPRKIDIGGVFTVPPSDHKTVAPEKYRPLQRELVFDVDMDDYSGVRSCCTGARICPRCWLFMQAAVIVVDAALREDFGFKHIMWVFSGRRGVHCWVCDDSARQLPNEARGAIVEYLTLIVSGSGEDDAERVYLRGVLHPAVERSIGLLESLFLDKVASAEEGQGVLEDVEGWTALLQHVPDDSQRDSLSSRFSRERNARARWKLLCAAVPRTVSNKILLLYTYPRLDVGVSKHRNHLLKSPFAVHPKTGRVCVPFLAEQVFQFDPFTAPVLSQLEAEINDYDAGLSLEERRAVPDWEKTSIADAVRLLSDFVDGMKADLRRSFRESAERVAAATGDW
eukprot:PLAT12986.1.p1 GENE.PLAT12986.1~~PLAT12986.1.p1  ORF type:complete len:472 (+),score=148.52 PLAT12986.1:116-1417(+)